MLEASLLQQNPELHLLLFLRVSPGEDFVSSMDELEVLLELFLLILQPKNKRIYHELNRM